MTNDKIRELAQEAGFRWGFIKSEGLMDGMINFAKLVAQHEREVCAKVCEDLSKDMTPVAEQAAKSCATFVRSRKA
jgi:hypothetical protein